MRSNVAEQVKLDFSALFQSQEKAAVLNWSKSPFLQKAVPFLADNVALNLAFLGEMPFNDAEKKTAVRILGVDSISHVVIASRLGLWGASPQSVAILRGALESVTLLASVVFHQKYRTAISEVNRKFNQIEFESALHSLGKLGKNIKALWGQMSNLGPHASAKRIQLSEYEYDGTKYDRIGCAIDPEGAAGTIYYALYTSILVTECLHNAAEQDGHVFPGAAEYEDLIQRSNSFSKEFIEGN